MISSIIIFAETYNFQGLLASSDASYLKLRFLVLSTYLVKWSNSKNAAGLEPSFSFNSFGIMLAIRPQEFFVRYNNLNPDQNTFWHSAEIFHFHLKVRISLYQFCTKFCLPSVFWCHTFLIYLSNFFPDLWWDGAALNKSSFYLKRTSLCRTNNPAALP